jgi:hypothetical protein
MLLQKKTRHSKLNETHIVLKKQMFEALQIEICVDVEGCLGNLQAYGPDHPYVHLVLTWLYSL